MTEQEIAELQRKLREAETARDTAQSDAAKLRKESEDKDKAEHAAKVKGRRDAITALFNAAVEAKRIEPKVREQFSALTGYETDDAAALRVTDEQVKAHIESVGKPADKNSRSRPGGTGSSHSANDEPDYSQMTPDEELRVRTDRLCRSTNQDPNKYQVYLRASQQILREDKDLAERYKYASVDRFSRRG